MRLPRVGFALMALSTSAACATPWGDLERRYLTAKALPPDSGSSVIITVAGKRTWGFFTQDGPAILACDSSGVYLFPSGPESVLDKAVHIPMSDVTGCSRFEAFGEPRVALWIETAQVEIEVHRGSDSLVSWCGQHGVPMMRRGQLLELLHGIPESDDNRGEK